MKNTKCPKCKLSAVCLHQGIGETAGRFWRCGECGGYFRCADEWGKGDWLGGTEVCGDFAATTRLWNAVGTCAHCRDAEMEQELRKCEIKKHAQEMWR